MKIDAFKCDRCDEIIEIGVVTVGLSSIIGPDIKKLFPDETHHVCFRCLSEALEPDEIDDSDDE